MLYMGRKGGVFIDRSRIKQILDEAVWNITDFRIGGFRTTLYRTMCTVFGLKAMKITNAVHTIFSILTLASDSIFYSPSKIQPYQSK